ncbi:MAG: rhodanese-like domain-containing protein, partial [Cyanobacteria bacterium J06639_18]
EEYELSHLKTAELFTSVQDLLKDVTCHVSTFHTPIVVYCSIGYRSADVVNSLVKAGFSHVFNLSGGIFQWVNEERPIFQKNQSVKSVHPYNKVWGKLLKPEYRDPS